MRERWTGACNGLLAGAFLVLVTLTGAAHAAVTMRWVG